MTTNRHGKARLLGAALSLCALALGAREARADGLATSPSALPARARAPLAAEIAAHRARHPEAFTAVRSVQGHLPEVYGKKRNPVPAVSPELRALGPAALLPMLDALAFTAPPRGAATDAEWTALTVGMLEAVGLLRDARSGVVLRAAFEGSAATPAVQSAAARAMGRLCGDAELGSLAKHAAAAGARQRAAIEGLGECKRVEAARQLAALLPAAAGDDAAEVIAGALGAVGSSWAWKAMGPGAAATGAAVREVAARALVHGFAHREGAARAAMHRGLFLVEQPLTLELIREARTATPRAAEALDALKVQMERQLTPR